MVGVLPTGELLLPVRLAIPLSISEEWPDRDRKLAHSSPSPRDARWNAERQAVEFGVEIGEYPGVVRVPRRAFQRLLPERPAPERCVEAYYLQRTRFESIAERKLRRRPGDRGWEYGDQWAGPALSADSRRSPGLPPTAAVDPKPPFAAREKSATRVQVFGPSARKRLVSTSRLRDLRWKASLSRALTPQLAFELL